jgi:hypothetical protein
VSEVSRKTTLGPVELTVLERLSVSELHLENVRLAWVAPAPTFTLNVRDGFFGLSEPVNVSVWLVEGGGDAGVPATSAVVSETAVALPLAFDPVTATRRVEPTSPACTA